MKKIVIALHSLVLIVCTLAIAAEGELEVQEKKLISQRPPFTLTLPSEFQLIHSSSSEYPEQSSRTRAYFLVKEKDKKVEEMFIIQIADKTDRLAEPMTAPPLRPDAEKRTYLMGEIKKRGIGVNYLIQLIAWNPNGPSLQPIVKKGIAIPSHWALQGQFLFVYEGEHAALVRYSKDVHSFGFRISEKGDDWKRESISGNEKKAYETFRKTVMGMMDSITFKSL